MPDLQFILWILSLNFESINCCIYTESIKSKKKKKSPYKYQFDHHHYVFPLIHFDFKKKTVYSTVSEKKKKGKLDE